MNYSKNIDKIITSILSEVLHIIKGAKFDKTFKAKIIEKTDEGKYLILYMGNQYYAVCHAALNTGDIVRVCAPQNNWNELFIVSI